MSGILPINNLLCLPHAKKLACFCPLVIWLKIYQAKRASRAGLGQISFSTLEPSFGSCNELQVGLARAFFKSSRRACLPPLGKIIQKCCIEEELSSYVLSSENLLANKYFRSSATGSTQGGFFPIQGQWPQQFQDGKQGISVPRCILMFHPKV